MLAGLGVGLSSGHRFIEGWMNRRTQQNCLEHSVLPANPVPAGEQAGTLLLGWELGRWTRRVLTPHWAGDVLLWVLKAEKSWLPCADGQELPCSSEGCQWV